MKNYRIMCILLVLFMTLSTLGGLMILPVSAVETADYVQDGLFAWFKGDENTRSGQNTSSNVWHDLVGGHDLSVNTNSKNYFTEEGLHVEGTQHYFSDEILNLVNSSYFTIEIEFGDFEPIGADYNVFMNSSNDYFSLFRRVSEDVIEWKFGGGSTRPKIWESMRYLGNHLLTFTCEYGGSVIMYVDGREMARADCDLYMGANNLFIGQNTTSRSYEAVYKNIRFYSRPLTAEEVTQNATAAGYDAADLDNAPSYITVAQPVTNIVGDIAMVRPINSKAEFEEMMNGEDLPATAIYEINEDLEVLDSQGNPFATVAEVMEDSEYKVLPCFSIQSKTVANALAEYLNQSYFYDVQLMSSDREVLKYARDLLSSCYGILDLRAEYENTADLSPEQLLDIRRAVKTYNAYVAILPAGLCRNEDVQYLYERQVNVWAWGSAEPDETEKYFSLLSGAVGVVTDDTAGHLDIACNKLAENTLTRVPTNVGHRGIPSKAPECTLEGSILAYELGSNVIEMDVYLSKDGHVIVMHDGTTGRTCDKNLTVEQSTLAELKQLYANKGYENDPKYSQCRIPTLEEYLEWFKGKDCLFFIEIKSGNTAIVPAIKKLVDKYDMYDQCSVITFSASIMAAMRKDYPEMSVGALCSSYMSSSTNGSEGSLRQDAKFFGPYNATLNPSFSGLDGTDLRACMIRGVSIYPWTISGNTNILANFFLWGYAGLTNDHVNLLGTTTHKITLSGDLEFDVGKTTEIQHSITDYLRRTTQSSSVQITVLDGEATVNHNKITLTKDEAVTFITSSQHGFDNGIQFTMYTQPMTVNEPVEPETTEPETTVLTEPIDSSEATKPTDKENGTVVTDGNSSDSGSGDSNSDGKKERGCKSAIGGMTLMLISLGAVLAVSNKKKED